VLAGGKGRNCLIGSARRPTIAPWWPYASRASTKSSASARWTSTWAEINILLQDAGYDLKDVVMFQTPRPWATASTTCSRSWNGPDRRAEGRQADGHAADLRVGGEVYRIKRRWWTRMSCPDGKALQAGPHVVGRLRFGVSAGRSGYPGDGPPDAIKSVQAMIQQMF